MFNTSNSNLLRKNDTAEVDTSVLKISIISGIGVLIAVVSSYFISLIYKELSANNFISAAASIFMFIIVFFLQSLFVKSTSLLRLIALGETFGLASFLIFNNYSFILLIAIILTYLSLYVSLKKSKKELRNQLQINIHKVAKVSVPKIITAIVILISVIYSQPFFPENINISKSLIKSILAPSEMLIKIADNYLKLGIKNFSVEMTISQIAKENNLSKELLEAQLQGMGLAIKPNETILDAAYNFINGKLQGLNQTIKWSIFGSMFLLIFFTIKSFFWIFHWLIYLFIYLFYEILMALGFAKLSYEQISKEIIVL